MLAFDKCSRCGEKIAMKGYGVCLECFHETHDMCPDCCWKDYRFGDDCHHRYYRPECPTCKGKGWLPKEEVCQA